MRSHRRKETNFAISSDKDLPLIQEKNPKGEIATEPMKKEVRK